MKKLWWWFRKWWWAGQLSTRATSPWLTCFLPFHSRFVFNQVVFISPIITNINTAQALSFPSSEYIRCVLPAWEEPETCSWAQRLPHGLKGHLPVRRHKHHAHEHCLYISWMLTLIIFPLHWSWTWRVTPALVNFSKCPDWKLSLMFADRQEIGLYRCCSSSVSAWTHNAQC